jgi:hypothetical protein
MKTAESPSRKRYQIMLEPTVRKEARRIEAEQDITFSDAVNWLLTIGICQYDLNPKIRRRPAS